MGIDQLKNIIRQFDVCGDLLSCEPFGNGHINDTFLVEFKEDSVHAKYVLQKINSHVFKQPQNVAHNIELVLNRLKEKGVDVLKTYSSHQKPFVIDADNDYWRLYNFIPNSKSVEVVKYKSQAFEAAKSFAEFQRNLLDANPKDFFEIIPDFHKLDHRFCQFESARLDDVSNRVKAAMPEIAFVNNRTFISDEVLSLMKDQKIPLRITHNDTKLNNVLVDVKTGKGLCVIDLDTVMPGSVLFDFGDMVRTFTSPVAEDEKEVGKVIVRTEIFEEICRGYLPVLANDLTKSEKDNFVLGAKYMILMIGLRFLTDYLQGDIYFKTKYDDHNLARARNQFALLKNLESKEKELNSIVEKYC